METNVYHNNLLSSALVLDSPLENYLKTMGKNPDVMFVLFSDHGQRYSTRYLAEQSPEADTDTFHPTLFLILPENPERFFSKYELKALETNQNRLLTARDLHFLFAKFWDNDSAGNSKR